MHFSSLTRVKRHHRGPASPPARSAPTAPLTSLATPRERPSSRRALFYRGASPALLVVPNRIGIWGHVGSGCGCVWGWAGPCEGRGARRAEAAQGGQAEVLREFGGRVLAPRRVGQLFTFYRNSSTLSSLL